MNDKQSSSIDFFWNQLPEILPFTVDTETAVKLLEAFEQAKAMHKEEVVDFAFNFYYDFSNLIGVPFNLVSENKMNAEFYYDKVFGGNNEQ